MKYGDCICCYAFDAGQNLQWDKRQKAKIATSCSNAIYDRLGVVLRAFHRP